MDDFEEIYTTVSGNRRLDGGVLWAENAYVEGTDFSWAYHELWVARENLCRRFGMDWEDPDLERIMEAVLRLSEDVARRMFSCGITYAEKGRKL